MTGNNKFWRASLAGLASVAMLATMGVAASTANANATPSDAAEDKVTVWFGSTHAEGYKGETLADIAGGYGASDETWTLDGTTPVDWNTVITKDVTLTALKSYNYTKPAGSSVTTPSTYYGVTIDLSALAIYEQLPGGSSFRVQQGTKEISKNVLPVDKGGDHKLVTEYTVAPDRGKAFTVSSLTDEAFLTVAAGDPGANVRVTAKTVAGQDAVRTVKVNGVEHKGYVVGAHSDGNNDDDTLIVDVPNNTKFTIPAWFSYPQNGTDKAVTDPVWTRDRDDSGKEYKAGDSETIGTLYDREFTIKSTSEKWTVRFYSDSELVDSQFVSDGGYAKLPADPTIEGYTFRGWKATPDLFKGLVTKANDKINNYAITANVDFVAKWGNKTGQVKVTFEDADYNGKQKDVVKYFDAGSFLNSSDAPAWTRSGYVLAGWTLNGKDYKFGQQFTNTTEDFVLKAEWVKAAAPVAKAALEYITSADEVLFTDASWAEYETVYTAAEQEYKTAEYQGNGTVSDEASAKVVSELASAWKKLVFKTGAKFTQPAYRFYNRVTNEHLFTTNEDEVAILKGNPDWSYENIGFNILDSYWYGKQYKALGSFDQAAADAGFTGTEKANVVAQLAAAADPVTVEVSRLYNRVTNEHLFTDSAAERDTLVGGDWGYESSFYAPVFSSTKSVYRLYNPILNQHLFTQNQAEVDQTTAGDWKLEGVVFKAL